MRVAYDDLVNFSQALLQAAGGDSSEASSISESLVWCDAVELPNQGVWRLPVLVENIERGGITSPCHFSLTALSPTCASITGNGGSGHYLCREGMSTAIRIAKQHGIACVAIHDSTFCGALSYYGYQAAENGCIAFIFSNSFPKVAAFGGIEPVLGTNPLAVAAPGSEGHHFIFDMSTSTSAGSSITKAAELGIPLPEGIAVAKDGSSITDPNVVHTGSLLPFGGAKGFGLGLVVEILSGLLTSAKLSNELKSFYKNTDTPGGNGQFLLAINVATFMSTKHYLRRFSDLRRLVLGGHEENIRLPGDRKMQALRSSKANGVKLDRNTIAVLERLGSKYTIPFPIPL